MNVKNILQTVCSNTSVGVSVGANESVQDGVISEGIDAKNQEKQRDSPSGSLS